jgi:hypothetical protein
VILRYERIITTIHNIISKNLVEVGGGMDTIPKQEWICICTGTRGCFIAKNACLQVPTSAAGLSRLCKPIFCWVIEGIQENCIGINVEDRCFRHVIDPLFELYLQFGIELDSQIIQKANTICTSIALECDLNWQATDGRYTADSYPTST